MTLYSRFTASALFTLAIVICSPVSGEDFLSSGASARAAGAAGAYLSGTESPMDAMALNPAGLTRLNSARVEAGMTLGFARGSFSNAANTNGRLDANGIAPQGAFGTPLGHSRFSIGFAALPQLMSAARWHYFDAPGGVGGVSYPMTNHNSEITGMRMSAGIGYRVNSHIDIGATVGALYNTNKLQTAYIFQSHPALAGLKTQLDLQTSGVGWGGSAGVLVRASSSLEFGVAYRSQTTVVSRGSANGNIGIQLAALGLGAARPDFRYDARVDNVFPQSLMANFTWKINPQTRLVTQGDWINWKRAFVSLPVTLTNGNNADINGLLGTNGIVDGIPLQWKDQGVGRVAIERTYHENATFRAGYSFANSPVPNSTLSPLTAAIAQQTISGGFGYKFGFGRFDFAYSANPSRSASTGTSALKAGEYSNSHVSVFTQGVLITYSASLR